MLDSDYRAERLEYQLDRIRQSPPYWHDPRSRPCKCCNAAMLGQSDGASDGGYVLFQCRTCGNRWSKFIEG